MGIQLHSLPDDIGTFRPGSIQEPHLIHCVKQFPVGRFKAVDLWNSTRHDDADSIWHIIRFQRIRDFLLHNGAGTLDDTVDTRVTGPGSGI